MSQEDAFAASDRFGELIEDGKITFTEVEANKLDAWTASLVESYLSGVPWKLGNVKIGESVCLQVDDPLLGFLDSHPREQLFIWTDAARTKSFSPDEASVHLLKRKHPEVDISLLATDDGKRSVIRLRAGNNEATVKDIKNKDERIITFTHEKS